MDVIVDSALFNAANMRDDQTLIMFENIISCILKCLCLYIWCNVEL